MKTIKIRRYGRIGGSSVDQQKKTLKKGLRVAAVILALVFAVGGVGTVLAWKTDYLDRWLPPNIKTMFGRGEGAEEVEEPEEEPEEEPGEEAQEGPEEKPESEPDREFGLFSKLSFIYKDRYSIWTANEDGTNAREVYKHTDRILAFSISPDGKLVAFTSGQKLWVMNTDLTGRRRIDLGSLPPDGAAPAWSPNSQEFLLALEEGDNRGIYKVDVVSGSVARLTDGIAETAPSWSPDGERISFSLFGDTEWEVHVMNLDGSGKRKLMEGFDSAWSPDGSKLAINHELTVKIVNVSSEATVRTVKSSGEVYNWGEPCELFWGSNGKIYLSGGFYLQPEIVVIDASSGSLGKVKGIAGWNPIYIDIP